MSVNFPVAITNYLTLQDGVDKVIAQHPNDRGSDITALQTLLGAMGVSQAYSESYKNLLIHYSWGCQTIFNSTTAYYVNAGELVFNDGSGNFAFRRNTAQISINTSVLDTGSLAASSTYYIYAVADASGTTFTCVASLSSSAPTGYTKYRQIGQFTTDGSSHISAGSIISTLSSGFGTPVSKSPNTAYQAATDGIVTVTANWTNGQYANLVSDSNPTPSYQYFYMIGNGNWMTCGAFPVKKGNYYSVNINGSIAGYDISFVPMGT